MDLFIYLPKSLPRVQKLSKTNQLFYRTSFSNKNRTKKSALLNTRARPAADVEEQPASNPLI